jgi:hypothetical protein
MRFIPAGSFSLLLCRPAALAFALLALAGCGGGGVGSGGTGTTPASLSVGTVTGFGSIYVDGARFDDSNSAVQVETVPGSSELAEVRLGQRVEVEFEVDGVAKAIRVEAELRGPVSSPVAANWFRVLGQNVYVNGDGTAGPVTQFGGGYASLADVAPGHQVEVHGVPTIQSGVAVLLATRVDKLAVEPAYVRVAGTVSALSGAATARTFNLGPLVVEVGSASVVPTAAVLTEGLRVVVLARLSGLRFDGGTFYLAADQVRVRERRNGNVEAYLGGAITELDTAAVSFTLDGVRVDAAGAAVMPAGRSLANGQYVQVRGRFAAAGNGFVATRVKIRDPRDEAQADLRGTLTGYQAATKTFSVRDVRVDASSVTPVNCPSNTLAEGQFVEVRGVLTFAGVSALEVKCQSEPAGAIVERRGAASSVNLVARSFVLTPTGQAALTVKWGALTFFRDLTPDQLEGRNVRVEGVWVGPVLVAVRIRPNN